MKRYDPFEYQRYVIPSGVCAGQHGYVVLLQGMVIGFLYRTRWPARFWYGGTMHPGLSLHTDVAVPFSSSDRANIALLLDATARAN